jgi:predicted RNA-binding protein YlqC (UPF0109 family)
MGRARPRPPLNIGMADKGVRPTQSKSMIEQTANPKALIEHVAKALVNAPDQVIVEEVDEDGELVVELEVAEDDMGRVIGKSGKIARAMRNLLNAAGTKLNRRCQLEILE